VRHRILGVVGNVTLLRCKFNRLFRSEKTLKIGYNLTKLSLH